jgi:benzoylformate decarboxylase
MSRTADLLAEGRFPLIISGAGVAQEDAIEQMVKLAESLAAAVCCEHRLNLDYNPYPTEEDHFVGPFHPEAEYVKDADVILAIGCKLFVEFQPSKKSWISPGAKLIHLNSDASEIGNLYRVEVGLCSSVGEGMDELLMALSPRLIGRKGMLSKREQRVRSFHEAFLHRREDYFGATKDCEPLKVGRLAQKLAGIVSQNTTLVSDAVTSNDALVEYVPRHNTKSYYASAIGAGLGWGMGASLGVKIGDPKRQVICVVGDGAFMFGAPALHTAEKCHVPVDFIAINNSSYAAVKAGLLRYKGQAVREGVFPGTDIGGPDYVTIAKGFGVSAFKATSLRDLSRLPKVIGKEGGPVLVEAVTDPADAGRSLKSFLEG